jgi:hypothetical protein
MEINQRIWLLLLTLLKNHSIVLLNTCYPVEGILINIGLIFDFLILSFYLDLCYIYEEGGRPYCFIKLLQIILFVEFSFTHNHDMYYIIMISEITGGYYIYLTFCKLT